MTENSTSAEDRVLNALSKILESAVSPEMIEAQQLILRRLATTGDLFPSRIPPPLNITEVGGYLNLIASDPVMYSQVLASALGIGGPNPMPGFDAVLPAMYFLTRSNDRPPGPAEAATPVQVRVRNDFAQPLAAALDRLHALGAQLPILAIDALLPPLGVGAVPPDDLLPYLGRVLTAVPSAALVDPSTDPLAIGQDQGNGPQAVVARQLDASATDAASVSSSDWDLWTCDPGSCTQSTVTGTFVEIDPILSDAGWIHPAPVVAPTTATNTGAWNRWVNVTGLVAEVSTFGEELRLLYSDGQIAASVVRERHDWVWDGTRFVAPA